jgi:hypothetical protein
VKTLLLSAVTAGFFFGQQAGSLKIVVIAGEDAVNVIQQRTAVAPIVEVRDRNNAPVAGVPVTFTIGGSGASFGGGVNTLTVTTNALGQATASGLTPTASGALRITASAALQGQTATATIAQTNVMTAAQAAAAGGGTSTTAGTGGAAAGGGGGISATTLGIVGAAVAGGAVVATQTDILGGKDGFIVISGQVFSTVRFGGVCTVPPGVGQAPQECYGPPVAGALVSSSLDGNTTTTDGAGNFDLTTTVPLSSVRECRSYTLTITAAGHPTYTVPISGFSGNEQGNQHRQAFSLSPPSPMSMGGGGC